MTLKTVEMSMVTNLTIFHFKNVFFSGKERGGVGIQLPSISIWPWSTVRQHRAATIIKNKPKPQVKKPVVKQNVPVKNIVHKNHQKPPPPISLRRKEATESNRFLFLVIFGFLLQVPRLKYAPNFN